MGTVRKPVAAGAVLVLAAALMAVIPSPARAAAGCTAGGCHGRDPSATGCASGASTAVSFAGASVRVELRWSAGCRANWARATAAPAGHVLFVENEHGARQSLTIPRGRNTNFTAMVDGSGRSRACLGIADSDVLSCTGWR